MSSFSPHSDLGAGLAVFSISMVETEPPMQGQEIVLSHFWGTEVGHVQFCPLPGPGLASAWSEPPGALSIAWLNVQRTSWILFF